MLIYAILCMAIVGITSIQYTITLLRLTHIILEGIAPFITHFLKSHKYILSLLCCVTC